MDPACATSSKERPAGAGRQGTFQNIGWPGGVREARKPKCGFFDGKREAQIEENRKCASLGSSRGSGEGPGKAPPSWPGSKKAKCGIFDGKREAQIEENRKCASLGREEKNVLHSLREGMLLWKFSQGRSCAFRGSGEVLQLAREKKEPCRRGPAGHISKV